jgi:hypothetical protein
VCGSGRSHGGTSSSDDDDDDDDDPDYYGEEDQPEIKTDASGLGGRHKTICCCGEKEKCKMVCNILNALATEYPEQFAHRIGYTSVPRACANSNQSAKARDRTKRAKFYDEYLARHEGRDVKVRRIAYHHFHPAVTKEFSIRVIKIENNNRTRQMKQFPWKVSKTAGKEAGYTTRLEAEDKEKGFYITIPNYSLRQAMNEIARFYELEVNVTVP